MTSKLNCPVCGYTEIGDNTCPNCDTDLSLIRMLQQLPQTETSHPHQWLKVAACQLAATGVILLIGMGLGVWGSFLLLQPQTLTATINSPSPVVIIRPRPAPVKPSEPITYTVKSGDNLSAIAEKFCGKKTSWQVMVKANSQLKGREDYIDVGEVLKVPNCKEGA